MENIKNIFISALAAVVVVVVALSFRETPQTPAPLGAIPGNNIDSSYLTVGGNELAFVKKQMTATSVAPCIIKNPWGTGTTTGSTLSNLAAIDSISANFSQYITGETISIATSSLSSPNVNTAVGSATTSVVLAYQYRANASTTVLEWRPGMNLSTTTDSSTHVLGAHDMSFQDGTSPFFLRPNEVVFIYNGTTSPSTKKLFNGTCSAKFHRL